MSIVINAGIDINDSSLYKTNRDRIRSTVLS